VLPEQFREKYQAFLEEGESLRSVASEVAVQRMLFATFLQPALRKALEENRNGKEFPLGMIDRMMSWLAEISKTAMRGERLIQSVNHEVIIVPRLKTHPTIAHCENVLLNLLTPSVVILAAQQHPPAPWPKEWQKNGPGSPRSL